MNMLNKKSKKEIKDLINTIEYCYSYLATLEPMQDRLYKHKEKYYPDKWVELELDVTMKIAETRNLLSNTHNRLRELGVY